MRKDSAWRVEQLVITPRGTVPISDITPEERRRLAEKIHLAFVQAEAPEGVSVRLARSGQRMAAGE